MKSLKGQVYVAIICIILGLMLAYQFKAVKHITVAASRSRIDDVQNQLTEVQKQKEGLEKEIQELETERNQYEKNASDNDAWVASLTNQLNNLRDYAGLTKLQGPGALITVSSQSQDQSLDPTAAQIPIDYRDLLDIINELNATGAEAIMINGQRIVNTTQIRNVGDAFISINGVRSSAYEPFKIYAIGDPNSLETALNMPGGIKDDLVGLSIKIQKSNNVTINPYQRSTDMKYAKPIKDGE